MISAIGPATPYFSASTDQPRPARPRFGMDTEDAADLVNVATDLLDNDAKKDTLSPKAKSFIQGTTRRLKAAAVNMARYFVSFDLVKDLAIGSIAGTVIGALSGMVTIVATLPGTIALWCAVSLGFRALEGLRHPDDVLNPKTSK